MPSLAERPPISDPRAPRARLARQPALGLAGATLVIPVALALGLGLGGAERSLLVLGPISTFALPVIAMVAFWWEDWPGILLRPPLSGLADTVLVAAGGVLATIAGQAVVAHVDLRGVFDPGAGPGDAPTFPATMPLAAAVFVVILQHTLVAEGWPLRRLDRFAGGALALAVAWVAGAALYVGLVRDGPVAPADAGGALVCVGALQVAFYVVLAGWPFHAIGSRAARLLVANAVVLAGGCGAFAVLSRVLGIAAPAVSAAAGAIVAAGLVVGMLFEGWLDGLLPERWSRACGLAAVALVAVLLYAGLVLYADAAGWDRAEPEDWVAYAGLNAIGAGVILHVAIGRRWPFAAPPTPDTGDSG